jgi:hypothetical protein
VPVKGISPRKPNLADFQVEIASLLECGLLLVRDGVTPPDDLVLRLLD